MSSRSDDLLLPFNCNVCSKQLTARTAMVTNCGHFFCLSPPATCTRLRESAPTGICEQCGSECNAVVTLQRAADLDTRVNGFVFGNPPDDLKFIAETIEFRESQHQILSERANEYQATISDLKHKLSNLQGAMTKKENDWRQRVNDLLREIEQLKTRVDNQQQLPPGHQHSNNRDNVPFQPQPTAETCTSITTMPNGRSNPYQSGSRIRDHDLDLDLDINLNRANSSRTRLMSRSGSEPLSALDRKTVHTFPMSQGVSKTASRRHSFAAPGPSREGAILTATHTATGSRPGTGTGTGTGTTVPAPISFHHSTQHAVLSSRQTMQHRIHSTTPGTMNSRYNNQRNERRRYRSRDVVGLKRSKSMPYSRR